MHVTRRQFLQYCTTSAPALGLSPTDLLKPEKARAEQNDCFHPSALFPPNSACGYLLFFPLHQTRTPETPKMMQIPIKAFSYLESGLSPVSPRCSFACNTSASLTGTLTSSRCPISSSTTTFQSPGASGKKQNRPFLSVLPD